MKKTLLLLFSALAFAVTSVADPGYEDLFGPIIVRMPKGKGVHRPEVYVDQTIEINLNYNVILSKATPDQPLTFEIVNNETGETQVYTSYTYEILFLPVTESSIDLAVEKNGTLYLIGYLNEE